MPAVTSPRRQSMDPQSELWEAVTELGDEFPIDEIVALVARLMKQGADPTEIARHDQDKGNTPMHRAAMLGRANWVEVFQRVGANLMAPNANGFTQACQAASSGQVRYLEALRVAGFDLPGMRTGVDRSPLLLLALNGRAGTGADVVDYLVGVGCDPDQPDARLKRPVHAAAGNPLALERLAESGADLGAPNKSGETVAHIVAEKARTAASAEHRALHVSSFLALLARKVDMNITDPDCATALNIAERSPVLRDILKSHAAANAAREAISEITAELQFRGAPAAP